MKKRHVTMAPRASGRTNNPDKPVNRAFEQLDGDHQEEYKKWSTDRVTTSILDLFIAAKNQ